MRKMRHRRGGEDGVVGHWAIIGIVVVVTLAAIVGVIGFLGAAALAGSATRTNGTVSLRTTSLGPILVNSKGHTLYLFAKDRNGKSACYGSCAKFWPPLLSHGKPTAGSGVEASRLGRTRRSNGSLQVTYNKHPLYTFALDRQAGQTKGEGNSAFGGSGTRSPPKGERSSRPRRRRQPQPPAQLPRQRRPPIPTPNGAGR